MPLSIEKREKVGPMIGVRLPLSLHEAVWEIAERENVSLGAVVRAIVKDALPRATAPKKAAEKPKPSPASSKGPEAVTDELCDALAAKHGVKPADVRRSREKFLNHYQANGKRWTDWPAAFRNWLAKDVESKAILPLDPHKEKRPAAVFRVNGREFASVEAYEEFMSSGNDQQ